MKAPEPGVYRGIDFDTYARWDAVNHSILRHLGKTPAHARWEQLNQRESTSFQALGHLIHFALLEPERFKTEGPVVAPDVDRRTTVGKREWAEFIEANTGRPFVKQKELDILLWLQRSVAEHATAREALYGPGVSELSLVWDEKVGKHVVRCKARLDRICEIGGYGCIADLKTMSRPASTYAFQNAVKEYGYHTGAAFYLRGAAHLVPPDEGTRRKFIWIACETEPPYCVRMFEADEASLSVANDEIESYLATYAECEKTNSWPGWPQGVDLAGLPGWALKQFNVE